MSMRGFYLLYHRSINNTLLLVLKVLHAWLLICFEAILPIILTTAESESDENDLASATASEEFPSSPNKGEASSLKQV